LSRPVGFGRAGPDGSVVVYATSAAVGDTIALVRLSAAGAGPEIVCAVDGFDVTAVFLARAGGEPELVTSTDPDSQQVALSAAAAADLGRLRELAGAGAARIIDRNATHCLAEICYPMGGAAYLTFGRDGDAVSDPLAKYTGLDGVRVQPRRPFSYRARDGRLITGFLTRPDGPPPWPAVLLVHGGPWSQDRPGLDLTAQHLAEAGLCCIQVNYRGSRGFGKQHRDAGDGQWSLAMQDDLVDALRSAPVAAVIDPQRIAAAGHGYGGYAALMLATQDDVPISAVVGASAPTDLPRYARNLLAVGGPAGMKDAARIGDPDRDCARLTVASPVHRAADLRVPVLLFHGRQDARVPVDHATSLAEALRRDGRDYELTIYEDEGHLYTRPQNIADVQARSIQFLLHILSERAGARAC
jgi:dipeptidyl aminopeptidase/acylaminoacyl peptidase